MTDNTTQWWSAVSLATVAHWWAEWPEPNGGRTTHSGGFPTLTSRYRAGAIDDERLQTIGVRDVVRYIENHSDYITKPVWELLDEGRTIVVVADVWCDALNKGRTLRIEINTGSTTTTVAAGPVRDYRIQEEV